MIAKKDESVGGDKVRALICSTAVHLALLVGLAMSALIP